MKKKEYQVGTMSFSQVENGKFSNWLVERSESGWTLKNTERYVNKDTKEDCLFWVLERDYTE